MTRPIGALIAAASVIMFTTSGWAEELVHNVVGPIPLSSVLYLNKRGAPDFLPARSAYWSEVQRWDEQALAYRMSGRIFTNPSNWPLQALPKPGGVALSERNTSADQICGGTEPVTERQARIIEHAYNHVAHVKGGATTWLYDYELQANDVLLLPPFSSSFSQAANIQLMLFAYCKLKDTKYLDLAKAAGDTLIAPIEEGGLANADQGETWFEEAPTVRGLNQYILNAHIYSVNVLFLLAEVSKDQKYKEAARKGVQSLEHLLPKFDAGYWTRYDLRPRYFKMHIEISTAPDVEIKSVELKDKNGVGAESVWTVCEQGCDRTVPQIRNGQFYRFEASLESARFYHPMPGEEFVLTVRYEGSEAPKVYGVGIRPGIKEFVEIKGEATEPSAVTAQVGIRDLGWHQPNDEYIRYHAQLLKDLYRRVPNPMFFTAAARFQNYFRVFSNQRNGTVPEYHGRPFDLSQDASADNFLARCFVGVDPLAIDLATAAKRLPQCATGAWALSALFSRLGFVVAGGERPTVSDGAQTFCIEDRKVYSEN